MSFSIRSLTELLSKDEVKSSNGLDFHLSTGVVVEWRAKFNLHDEYIFPFPNIVLTGILQVVDIDNRVWFIELNDLCGVVVV